MVMNFELLPNEILLDIFDYFDSIDLIRTFYNLNFRFNFLLNNVFQNYLFKFNSVSKRCFDMICQKHLPFIADRIIGLCLSDFDDTPGQINLFLSYIPSFSQFTRLQSLTIIGVSSYDKLLKIIDECHYLCNLTHLNFCFCYCQDDKTDFQIIINDIWNLPKLIHCNFGISFQKQQVFCTPTITSLSIKSINISNKITLKLNQINQLFEYTPYLKHLSVHTDSYVNDNYVSSPLPTLTELNINTYSSETWKMIILLQNMSNLYRLKINLMSNLIDGYQWEHLIRDYLPKVKIFQLEMKKIFIFNRIMQKRFDELINSFQNSFWIDEHQWFVRCFIQNKTIYLYTLSNKTDYFEELTYDTWRSTYPLDNQQGLYINKTSIYNETFFEQRIPSYICLLNIETLWIKFPINDQFWSLIPSLKQLRTLRISSYTDTFQFQFQDLLNRAPHLRFLSIYQDVSLPLQMSLFKYINTSIRRLNLMNYNHCFNEDECMILTRSSLASQCEVLSIRVNNRECIIKLLKNMINLRALNVRCEDVKYYKQLTSSEDENDELVQWLKDCLSSTYSILRNPDVASDILIWI